MSSPGSTCLIRNIPYAPPMTHTDSAPSLNDVLANVDELLFVVERLDHVAAVVGEGAALMSIEGRLRNIRALLADVIIHRAPERVPH